MSEDREMEAGEEREATSGEDVEGHVLEGGAATEPEDDKPDVEGHVLQGE